MNTREDEGHDDRDFYEAQANIGDPYFMYVIDEGVNGGGTSCFLGFESAPQLLNALQIHLDFWQWRNDPETAQRAVAKMIAADVDPYALSETLRVKVSAYMRKHAGVHLGAWGRFDDLCASADRFSSEIRKEFRASDTHESDSPEPNLQRRISGDEFDAFCDYLAQLMT